MKCAPKIDFSRVSEKVFVDIPSSQPALQIDLQRVGVRQRPIRAALQNPFTNEVEQFFGNVSFACSLPGIQRGIHMSRLEEALDETRTAGLSFQDFVADLSNLVAKTQGQEKVRIEFSAQHENRTIKNVSGKAAMELLTFYAVANRDPIATKTGIGLTVPFINACPCTQRWAMRDYYNLLLGRGYTKEVAEELVLAAPRQAHTNRGAAEIRIDAEVVSHPELYGILERSVPIIRELLKGCDEHELVTKAQKNAQFCEDNIRSIMAELVNTLGDRLSLSTLVSISVEVDESVHFHNLWAESNGTYGELCEAVRAAG